MKGGRGKAGHVVDMAVMRVFVTLTRRAVRSVGPLWYSLPSHRSLSDKAKVLFYFNVLPGRARGGDHGAISSGLARW
jgi:hypothetical protein